MSDQSSPAALKSTSESPPAGRPRREGNESLWKRARRTLGTNSLTFLQPQSRPGGMSLYFVCDLPFRLFNQSLAEYHLHLPRSDTVSLYRRLIRHV